MRQGPWGGALEGREEGGRSDGDLRRRAVSGRARSDGGRLRRGRRSGGGGGHDADVIVVEGGTEAEADHLEPAAARPIRPVRLAVDPPAPARVVGVPLD